MVFFNSGLYVGLVICFVLFVYFVVYFGWCIFFLIVGGIGFVWFVVWFMFFDVLEKVFWFS